MNDDEKKRWCLILECQPPPGEGYHVCEVRIQGLFLHFPITLYQHHFNLDDTKVTKNGKRYQDFFKKNQSFRVTTKMP